jgi:hypothetical protein
MQSLKILLRYKQLSEKESGSFPVPDMDIAEVLGLQEKAA